MGVASVSLHQTEFSNWQTNEMLVPFTLTRAPAAEDSTLSHLSARMGCPWAYAGGPLMRAVVGGVQGRGMRQF